MTSEAAAPATLVPTGGLRTVWPGATGSTPLACLWTEEERILAWWEGGPLVEIDTRRSGPAACLAWLHQFLSQVPSAPPHLDAAPRSYVSTIPDALVALALAQHGSAMLLGDGDAPGDVVFAHALPIALVPSIMGDVIASLPRLVAARQLLLLPSDSLSVGDAGAVQEKVLRRDYRRILALNRDLRSLPCSTAAILERWKNFVYDRFGEQLGRDELSALETIFSGNCFAAREYRGPEGWVCSSLICIEPKSRIFFDILAPWNLEARRRRPGFFTAVMNMLTANQRQMRYSLCYGRAPYKDALLSRLQRLTR